MRQARSEILAKGHTVELKEMVESAKRGDSLAFDRLVWAYRDMALGYARSLIPDEHRAEDAVQEALALAHKGLDSLLDSEAFVAWLRGIVRHRCLRGRTSEAAATCHDLSEVVDGSDLEGQTVNKIDLEDLLEVIARLPDNQREPLLLHYGRGLSHAEIGARLGVSKETVNMRLHAARTRLKRRLNMNEETTTSAQAGRVEESTGSLVTLRFAPNALPPFFSRLVSGSDSLCVVQCQPDGLVRAISARPGAFWMSGQAVTDTGQPFLEALPAHVVTEIIGAPHYGSAPVRTGIKTIDVFAPMVQGGRTGVFAEWGVGLLVLLPEMMERLGKAENRQAIYAFVPPLQDEKQWREANAELTAGSKNLEIYYIPVEDPLDIDFLGQFSNLDAKLVLTRTLAEQGVYPSIDPCRSSSRFQSGPHKKVASDVCELIERYYALQFSSGPEAHRRLKPSEWQEVRRARLAIKFLSQPFFVAEPYTGIPGLDADADRAAQTFAGIVSGQFDDLKWDSFTMTGDSPKQK